MDDSSASSVSVRGCGEEAASHRRVFASMDMRTGAEIGRQYIIRIIRSAGPSNEAKPLRRSSMSWAKVRPVGG